MLINSFQKVPKKFFLLLLLAILLRVFLMVTTFHPDLLAISFAQFLFAFKGIFNIYDYLGGLADNANIVVNYGRNFFTYPPLAYFTLGIFGWILRPVFNYEFFNALAVNLPNVLTDSRLFGHLFLTKLPYLFFDLGVLLLLVNYFSEQKKKVIAAILWLFNPLTLYTSYMVGQFDIIPVFFTVLALFLAKRKRLYWAAFSLGIGAAYKMFPLFFLPFLAVIEGKNLKKTLGLFLAGIAPYILSLTPFLSSASFRQVVLFSNQSQKMFFARIPVSGAEYLSLFTVLYIFLLGLAWMRKGDLWKWFLTVMLLFFSLTHYHPQWFLWITPFLIYFLLEYSSLWIVPAVLLLGWLVLTLLFEPSLSISLFAPISPSLSKAVSLSDLINPYYDAFQLKSLIRSVFAAFSLFLLSVIFGEKSKV